MLAARRLRCCCRRHAFGSASTACVGRRAQAEQEQADASKDEFTALAICVGGDRPSDTGRAAQGAGRSARYASPRSSNRQGASPPLVPARGPDAEQVRSHAWLRPHFAHADGRLSPRSTAFVIESEGPVHRRRYLRAATTSGARSRCGSDLHGPFLGRCSTAPASRRIDRRRSLCTPPARRLTSAGTRAGSTASWLPTFANARYLFGSRRVRALVERRRRRPAQVMADSVPPGDRRRSRRLGRRATTR